MNEPPFPDLASHLAYQHHFSVDEIASLEPLELIDLHDLEHGAGYSHHHHEEPV